MALEPVQTLILLAVIANLAVMGAVLLPPLLGRRGPLPAGATAERSQRPAGPPSWPRRSATGPGRASASRAVVESGAYDRVVRIVSWVFILATSTIVAVTGLWPETQTAILVLLAAAGLFVLVVHDLLPAGALGTAKFVLEGSVAITFATLLVVLTGPRRQPVLLHLPADRRRRGARRDARG